MIRLDIRNRRIKYAYGLQRPKDTARTARPQKSIANNRDEEEEGEEEEVVEMTEMEWGR